MSAPLLHVDGLTISYGTHAPRLQALHDVSFCIEPGGVLGLVGESGSGKSTVALAVLGLLDEGAHRENGTVRFQGKDIYAMDDDVRRRLRGNQVSIVFQDPFTTLNPGLRVGRQIAEPLLVHRAMTERQAYDECERLLREVGIADPAKMMRSYPHQLSGGMKQRALIATALACDPDLLILDEPTTALDVTVEAQILSLLASLRRSRSLAMLFISHNLGVVSRVCDDLCVLYAGRVVEHGPAQAVLTRPRHPYTKGLLASLPRLGERRSRLSPIPGRLPDLREPVAGCVFKPRCTFALPSCELEQILIDQGDGRTSRCWRSRELADTPWQLPGTQRQAKSEQQGDGQDRRTQPTERPLVQVINLRRTFQVGGWLDGLKLDISGGGFPIKKEPALVRAVDGVSLDIRPGEIVGLVGESGCGKTTLGRCLINLITPTEGSVRIEGEDLLHAPRARRRALLRKAQIVFQNPDSSLNPRKSVREILARPLLLHGLASGSEVDRRVEALLDMVQLDKRYADRYPHQMSGGEKQRVGIARALATEPRFIVCDEAVSALDVSVQASILNLLADLRDELGVAYLFISHDLSVISHIADRIVVMYRGVVVEEGSAEQVLAPPQHPYTQALLAAAPVVGRNSGKPAPPVVSRRLADVSRGCRYRDRCARYLGEICDTVAPPTQHGPDGHRIACHLPLQMLADPAQRPPGPASQ